VDARPEARVEEHHDRDGDLVYVLTIRAVTYSRAELDRLAHMAGVDLRFEPVAKGD
jgi:hypothetical protein